MAQEDMARFWVRTARNSTMYQDSFKILETQSFVFSGYYNSLVNTCVISSGLRPHPAIQCRGGIRIFVFPGFAVGKTKGRQRGCGWNVATVVNVADELPEDQLIEDEGLVMGRGVVTLGQMDSSAPSVAQYRFPSHTMDEEMQRLSDGHRYSAPTVQVKADTKK
jgi:hypothetical protein